MLIQKSIKPLSATITAEVKFESFVNSEEYQTYQNLQSELIKFESFVNSEEYQTNLIYLITSNMFESFVNSEEYQTLFPVILSCL